MIAAFLRPLSFGGGPDQTPAARHQSRIPEPDHRMIEGRPIERVQVPVAEGQGAWVSECEEMRSQWN
ncbi:hypothetical protein [Variovorax sp. PBL-H6]|uniref:hypothetical protein n=1 Tax=Variovorax sp. PBL-H6 TaxID=434009 RepID=UPI0013A57A80|nr:hypothetical protein [Variovorax sp. PBL-H6]